MPEMRWSLLGGTGTDPDQPLRWEFQGFCMSQVPSNRGVGATSMKITVIGAVLTVAVILAILIVLNIILDQRRSGSSSDGLDPQ